MRNFVPRDRDHAQGSRGKGIAKTLDDLALIAGPRRSARRGRGRRHCIALVGNGKIITCALLSAGRSHRIGLPPGPYLDEHTESRLAAGFQPFIGWRHARCRVLRCARGCGRRPRGRLLRPVPLRVARVPEWRLPSVQAPPRHAALDRKRAAAPGDARQAAMFVEGRPPARSTSPSSVRSLRSRLERDFVMPWSARNHFAISRLPTASLSSNKAKDLLRTGQASGAFALPINRSGRQARVRPRARR